MIDIDNLLQEQVDLLARNQNRDHKIETIHICAKFFNEKYFIEDIRYAVDHNALFSLLKTIKSPVLYWFTIDTKTCSAEKIRKGYEIFYNSANIRNRSSFKPKFDITSTTLYVGKVKTGFYGRLITHLGYHKSTQTAGLQLFHWFDVGEFSTLTLNYIILDKDMANMITVLEIETAQRLKPLLGKY